MSMALEFANEIVFYFMHKPSIFYDIFKVVIFTCII